VSDGLYNIIYDVYVQRDGNHQTENLTLKTDSAASTASHGKCMKYIIFLRPLVPAAHDRKTVA
jgi:hypothetical protein